MKFKLNFWFVNPIRNTYLTETFLKNKCIWNSLYQHPQQLQKEVSSLRSKPGPVTSDQDY